MTPEERRYDELRRLVSGLDDQLAQLRRDRTARGVDASRLGEDVRDLRREVQRLAEQGPRPDDVAGLRADVRRLVERTGALDDRLDEQDRAARDLAGRLGGAVQRLEERLARLEGVARSSPGVRLADLDTPGDDVRALAERAERGAAAAAAQLDEERLRALQHAVAEDERLRAARDRAVEDLVAASLVIARSEPGASGRPAAALDFAAARAAVEEHRRDRDRVAGEADRARRELAADRRRAAEDRGAIEGGRAAHAELVVRARARLAQALDRDELPPAWLDAALGPAPPQRDGWLDAGADLLAYRWTYGLTGEPALGEPPGAGASARRQRWYRVLTERSRPAR